MELEHIFSAASYLLESDIQNINEASNQQILDVVKKSAPELTKSIDQAKANTSEVLRILKDYTRKVIGTEAKSLDDAVKLIQKNPQSEITSITNMLMKAANYREEDLSKMTLVQKKRELTKVAEAKGIDTKGKTASELVTTIHNKLESTRTNPTSASEPAGRTPVSQEQSVEPFPGKRDLFLAAYNKTLQLGWPGEKIKVTGKDKEGNPEAESEVTGKLIPLDVGAKTGVKLKEFNFSKSPSRNWVKLAETLVYNKFKNNPAGLRKLSQAVDEIIEKNKNFKLSRRVKVRDFLSNFGGAFISRFGGSDADKDLFSWFVKKAAGMDIFEFQKLIIDKVLSTIDVSDDRITKMEKVITGVRKMMEGDSQNSRFTISPIKSYQGWDTYEVSYGIKSNIKPNTTPARMTEPLSFFLKKMLEYNKSPNVKTWTEIPSNEDIQNELTKIRDYITDPKKNPYDYSMGEDGPLSYIQEDKSGDKLVGTQYMYPTYLGKDGLRIIVKYKPETKE